MLHIPVSGAKSAARRALRLHDSGARRHVAALRGLDVQCGLTSLRGLCTLPAGAPSPASEHRDALRRPGRLVIHRPASPRLLNVDGPQPPPDRRSGPGRRPHRGRGRRARRRRLARPAHPFLRGGPVRPGRRADDRHRRARPSPPAGRLRPHGGRDLARARQRHVGARPLVLGQHADAAGSGRGAARHLLPRWPARRRRPGGTGRPSALRRSRAPIGRSLRRDAATGRGAPGRPTRPVVARRPGWTWRSWPTAGSR